MLSSERTRERGANRIIAAEQLSGVLPFTLDELTRERGDSSTRRALFPDFGVAPGGDADQAAGAPVPGMPFSRFDSGPGSDPIEQQGFEAGYRAGRDAGFAEGMKRGFEAGGAQANRAHALAEAQAGVTLAKRVEVLCESLAARFEQVEREAADEVVELAVEIARQALRATPAMRPEAIIPVVQEALASLFDERVRMRLLLHPRDAELVRSELGERLLVRGCEIVADHSITPGGCRIDTPRASVDATVETRWRRTLAAIGRLDDGTLAASPGAEP